ncbi:EAL domain-containing protein [Denitromonas iodatirespirans]|uniref:EAL domain-containing protein n=1 Tax=Denitromonas iodatirespirans TaxID=2795389 RepID=A0A944HFL0_DENI1|nr:EAL domain-containing protein [Denitromonas iodatirespirans]MBT0963806.1 EAL domain-containing protein [Denitromonas iodatirespirans]
MSTPRLTVLRFLLHLALCIVAAIIGTAAHAQSQSSTILSDEERAFLTKTTPVVFVSQTAYPPFEFVDPNTGARKGMMIELATWISTEFGFHAEFTDTVFLEAQRAVLEGRAQVLTSFFYSEARDKTFDFTDTVFDVPATIFVKADRPDITTLADLNGKRIAMQRGDYAEGFLRSKGVDFTLVATDEFGTAAAAVIDGRADALIGDEQIVLHYLYSNDLNPHMKKVGEPLYVGHNAMAVADGNRLLRSILNKGIAHARESGALKRISNKWAGTPLPDSGLNLLAYWPYAAALAALLVWGFLWNLRLRYVVHGKTAQLLQNQMRLEGIIQATRAGTWEWQLASGRIIINDQWAEMLGYTPDELQPFSAAQRQRLLHPDDREKSAALLKQHLSGEHPHYACEVRMRHKNGDWVWLLERGQITKRSAAGQPVIVSGTQIDVSASKLAEVELQLTASVFGSAREGIIITDADGSILDVNDAFIRITGYTKDEAIGKNPSLLRSDRHENEFYATMWRSLHDKGFWEGEIWNRRKSGEVFPEILTISAVRNDSGAVSHFVAVFSDISRLKEHEHQLERLAFFDDLTGLPNRVLLVDRLSQTMARARRNRGELALAYLDLDGFKEINDSLGHAVGDRVLVTIAERLTTALREEDTVARFGGDEFVIVLPDHRADESHEAIIRRLLDTISAPIHIGDQRLQVSASIGLAHYRDQTDLDSDQLIRQADQAMYQAKQAGKNRFHLFDAELDRAVRGRHEHIARIRHAIAANEFVLHYQPKVNMRSGALIGAEALIRWQHPQRGLLAPGLFLPDVESHHAVAELGEWVISTALAQIDHWRRSGFDLTVSINLAAYHLQQTDFPSRLQALLAKHPDVPPARLELEVLESSALEDINHVSSVIAACTELGVRFALDDFGTGYSSLIYLKRLPVHVLKIDQGFVRDMLHDPGDLSILEGVLGLARAFHREVIAEGVETEEHGKLLLQLGCEQAQGYGIARPMPADALVDWVANWTAPATWTQTGRLPQHEIELIYAASEHRAWLDTLDAFLQGRSAVKPEADPRRCRFGHCLDAKRGNATGAHPFDEIDTLHKRLHAIGEQLMAGGPAQDPEAIRQGSAELHACSEALLTRLQAETDARSHRVAVIPPPVG